MSVNRNVTVPLGNSGIGHLSYSNAEGKLHWAEILEKGWNTFDRPISLRAYAYLRAGRQRGEPQQKAVVGDTYRLREMPLLPAS